MVMQSAYLPVQQQGYDKQLPKQLSVTMSLRSLETTSAIRNPLTAHTANHGAASTKNRRRNHSTPPQQPHQS